MFPVCKEAILPTSRMNPGLNDVNSMNLTTLAETRLPMFQDARSPGHGIPGTGRGSRTSSPPRLSVTTVKRLLRHLNHLRQTYHVEFGCITAHGGGLFYNDASLKHHTKDQAERLHSEKSFLPVLKANFAETGYFFSAVIDEPSSHMFSWPELARELEVRFVNPGGLTAGPDQYFDLFDLVTPSLTRCEVGVFTARRTMPSLDESSGFRSCIGVRRGIVHSMRA